MSISAEQLKQFIERIERLSDEKSAISSDIKDVFAEAKANGFDPKIMREIIKKRKLERQELEEQESLVELYKHALGMVEK